MNLNCTFLGRLFNQLFKKNNLIMDVHINISTYTRRNCERECEARMIEDKCGCVLYYMPRTGPDTKVCSRSNYDCYAEIRLALELATNDSYTCKCLPSCSEINFSQTVSSSSLFSSDYMVAEEFLMNINPIRIKYDYFFLYRKSSTCNNCKIVCRKNIAVVNFFYESSSLRSFTRDEYIGFTEFICKKILFLQSAIRYFIKNMCFFLPSSKHWWNSWSIVRIQCSFFN